MTGHRAPRECGRWRQTRDRPHGSGSPYRSRKHDAQIALVRAAQLGRLFNLNGQLGHHRTTSGVSIGLFVTRRRVGLILGVSSRRWNAPGELFPRVGFVIANPGVSETTSLHFTPSAARRSSGSRRAKARSRGRGFLVAHSTQTPFACSFMRPRITWGNSFARLRRTKQSRTVAHEFERQTDQDRCEGREPRPLRYVSDGGGGDPAALFASLIQRIAALRSPPIAWAA